MRQYNKLSLKCKLLMLISSLVIVTIIIVSYVFYNKSYEILTKLIGENALNVAKTAACRIDGNELEKLGASLDSKEEYYKDTQEAFESMNQKIGQGMLYIIGNYDEKKYTYIVDGSKTVDIGHKQVKEDFAKEAALAFKSGMSYVSSPYYVHTFDKYYVSAFVPVFNSRGEVAGVVEYDYEGHELSEKLKDITIIIMLLAMLFVVAALGGNYLILRKVFKPMEHLVKGIGTIAMGDMTVRIKVKHEDEIGKIAAAVNENVKKITGILKKIRTSSEQVTVASKSILVSSQDASEAYEQLAVSIGHIADSASVQVEEIQKSKTVLELLSDEGQCIYTQVESMNDTIAAMEASIQGLEKYDQAYTEEEKMNEFSKASQLMKEQVAEVSGCLEKVAGYISKIYENMDNNEQNFSQINLSTINMTAITQEQIATSDEFATMARMLREQAKMLDESISKFKM